MSVVMAFSDANKAGRSLGKFKMERLVDLTLTNSQYLIFGKVVLGNADGDPQNASAQLRRGDGESFVTLDETSVRLPSADDPNRTEVSVQAAVDFGSVHAPVSVELACATFQGHASQAQLAAIHLDFLNARP